MNFLTIKTKISRQFRRSFLPLLFLAAAVSALWILPGCSGRNESLDTLLQKSFTAAEQANWSKALDYAEKALDKDSANTNALILQALALENTDRTEQALVQAAKAASDRNSFMAQYTYGRMLVQSEKFDQSLAPLLRAMELD